MAKRRSTTRLPRRKATPASSSDQSPLPAPVLHGPVITGDRIVRVVEGAMIFAEEWNGFCWVPSLVDVESVPRSPPASIDDLRRHGVPDSAGS
jgi:hypothetical protein